MTYIPDEIKIAIDGRYAEFQHEPFSIDMPPGDPAFTAHFGPKERDRVWQMYVMTFGDITPVGPTQDVWFRHWQIGVREHNDPMDHSLLDFPYPMWAPATKNNPHYIEVHNLTGDVQNVDLQVYFAFFYSKEDYARWMADLILLGYRLDVGHDFLRTAGMSRKEFESIYEDQRDKMVKKRPVPLLHKLPEVIELKEVE